MKKDYEKLLEILRRFNKSSGLKDVEVYSGDINGTYDTVYDINSKEVLDTMFSDGDVSFEDSSSHIVSDASYVCIVRYKNNESNIARSDIDKIYLFVDDDSQKEFMFDFVQKDSGLYQKVFEQKNYKGNISEYVDSKETGYKIVPSEELIKKNAEKFDNSKGRH